MHENTSTNIIKCPTVHTCYNTGVMIVNWHRHNGAP